MSSSSKANNYEASAAMTVKTATMAGAEVAAATSSGSHSSEQPQTKRQKIENLKHTHYQATTKTTTTTTPSADATQPDVIDPGEQPPVQHHFCSSLSSSANSISMPSSLNSDSSSPNSTPSTSRTTSLTQLLNVQGLVTGSVPAKSNNSNSNNNNNNSTATTRSSNHDLSTSLHSSDEVDRSVVVLPPPHSDRVPLVGGSGIDTSTADMREFESALTRQCLCGVAEHTLRKPFQSHFSRHPNGQRRIANLSEWPTKKLLQFLANLQLLFDIYLKQNSKGFICGRIMDVCDALICNDNHLIDELIGLASYGNAYVQYLAGRVLAAFLVIAKQELNDDWLRKLVDNLTNFKRLDQLAVQRMHFSLDIIKRIVEWKDVDLHPLEDEIVDASEHGDAATDAAPEGGAGGGASGYLHFHVQQPTLETNYFAMHYQQEEQQQQHGDQQHATAELLSLYQPVRAHTAATNHTTSTLSALHANCHIVTLTDSESFDTTHLKCIAIKILEHKWPGLMSKMSELIPIYRSIEHAEICILKFLELWENIISVKANLSIIETLPFYAQLEKLELLLLSQQLSGTVYKQMLSLFNEALCYGSTLALQDMLPEETCLLARQIVQDVKDYRIQESLPRRQAENAVSFIGYKRPVVVYAAGSIQSVLLAPQLPYAQQQRQLTSSPQAGPTDDDVLNMDKTILQKMVLLVLKSIAVMVKEIRSDSSDSSIDSTDFDAFQDMVKIQRHIHDALHKLESFIKHTLDYHPEWHFSKILIRLLDDQDDHLIEAMVCTLDVTSGITFRSSATTSDLVAMLNPVYTFLEFLEMTSNSADLLLDLLVSNETCFLLYLLRFLKYIRANWELFVRSCNDFGTNNTLDVAMTVLIRLRLEISRLVSRQLYPYDISPVLRLLESCESLYEGNELS